MQEKFVGLGDKMFQSRILTLNWKHEANKKCKLGKVAVKYFESEFVEK